MSQLPDNRESGNPQPVSKEQAVKKAQSFNNEKIVEMAKGSPTPVEALNVAVDRVFLKQQEDSLFLAMLNSSGEDYRNGRGKYIYDIHVESVTNTGGILDSLRGDEPDLEGVRKLLRHDANSLNPNLHVDPRVQALLDRHFKGGKRPVSPKKLELSLALQKVANAIPDEGVTIPPVPNTFCLDGSPI